jgi:hypothetical protein
VAYNESLADNFSTGDTGAIASRNMKMQFEQKVKAKHMCISWNVELSGTRLQNLQKAENTQLP